MVAVSVLSENNLQAICDVLGNTTTGLSGIEIGRMLARCDIADPLASHTKRHRLYAALSERQKQDRCGNNVLKFVQVAMEPVRYVDNPSLFSDRKGNLNHVMSFCGLRLRDDGKIERGKPTSTLSEAEERAGRLRSELRRRNVHQDVLAFCRPELVNKNYFHAVLEATKSVAEKVRKMSGLTADGAPLVDEAFGLGQSGNPILAFNTLQSETELSEHKGIMNLMKGMFGTFRNVTAHAPKISWPIEEQDALELLALCSLLHRRLDSAVRTRVI